LNKIVARFADGRVLKGTTADFVPAKATFHVSAATDPVGAKPMEIKVGDLKALFFVRDYEGNPAHEEQKKFDPTRPPAGRKIEVVFSDGEVLIGTTTGYQKGRPGFFVVPADAASNMERCYVISAATKEVKFL
jgi:hypothetical protein